MSPPPTRHISHIPRRTPHPARAQAGLSPINGHNLDADVQRHRAKACMAWRDNLQLPSLLQLFRCAFLPSMPPEAPVTAQPPLLDRLPIFNCHCSVAHNERQISRIAPAAGGDLGHLSRDPLLNTRCKNTGGLQTPVSDPSALGAEHVLGS